MIYIICWTIIIIILIIGFFIGYKEGKKINTNIKKEHLIKIRLLETTIKQDKEIIDSLYSRLKRTELKITEIKDNDYYTLAKNFGIKYEKRCKRYLPISSGACAGEFDGSCECKCKNKENNNGN